MASVSFLRDAVALRNVSLSLLDSLVFSFALRCEAAMWPSSVHVLCMFRGESAAALSVCT